MDDKRLERILSEDSAPEIDVNARKRAVNLAVSEFKTQNKKKNQKTSQGVSIFSRLIGIGNSKRGNETMEDKAKRRFMYGGMATAMAVVLVGGLSLTQLEDTVRRNEVIKASGTAVKSVSGADEKRASGLVGVKPVEKQNSEDLEREAIDLGSVAPAPALAVAEMQDAQVNAPAKDPLSEWRRDSNERVERAMDVPQESSLSKQDGRQEGALGAVVAQDKGAGKKEAAEPLDRWRRIQGGEPALTKESFSEREIMPEEIMEEKAQAPKASRLAKAKERVVGDSVTLYNAQPQTIAPIDVIASPSYKDVGRDKFEDFKTNPFKLVTAEPVSTFSSDVDTASYSFVRRQLNNGVLPQKDAVRIEEMVNYFNYNYPVPESRSEPFKPTVTVTDSPWAEGKKLMHIGIKGYQLAKTELRSNIVFLLDVSGSMNSPGKLPLVKNSMKMLLDSLHPDDTVSIVTYAGSTGVVLEPTKVAKRSTIINAMQHLRAGGGTAGAAGINLAYNMVEQNFDERSVNRVILATDGDFNVGITNREELKDFVERKRNKGIFLSVLGFGQGNYNDHMMQTLAQNGNGTAAYIDNLNEARKVLVQEATSSLFPIAKDVKFQVEFNPSQVAEYRLIGYETRHLNREDFNNDKIDAGDMGAGHTVTAIYEFIPVGSQAVSVDTLRYGTEQALIQEKPIREDNGEYAFLKIRYKLPTESKSKLITRPITASDLTSPCPPMAKCLVRVPSEDAIFSTAVAAFGQILKGGEYTGDYSYDDVIALAQQGKGVDKFGYRAEFINMVRLAKTHAR